MKVFIDTNILLDIYHLSGPDLEELLKLNKMVEKKKIDLLVSRQVVDEFWRNRERVIADAMKRFKESKATATVPNIIRIYPESKTLKEAVDKVNEIVRTLAANAVEDIEGDKLKADKVIVQLFGAITVGKVTDAIVARAKRRSDLGNPPGKRDSLGDAINWEWLLEQEIDFWDDNLTIVSSDGDFESELVKGKPKEYLVREWREKNPSCQLVLRKSLPDFLAAEFSDIQLAEELDKIEAIESLEGSGSFSWTHRAVAALATYDDFKDAEVKRILKACLENNQVRWILTDMDVEALCLKVIAFAKSRETAELAGEIGKIIRPTCDDDISF